ncbi:hypothetical protein K2X33_01795 [bacterium]|nr:hypothetical protein [bacterium]
MSAQIWLAFASSLWAADWLELKKVDFSILLAQPSTPQESKSERCFFRPEVAEALSRVQQRMRMVQAGVRVKRCYEPGVVLFGTGAAVALEPAQKETPGAPESLRQALLAEKFRVENAKKGYYVYEPARRAKLEKTPVADLP